MLQFKIRSEDRARWGENQTAQISPIVPSFALRATEGKPQSRKTQLIPSFELSWPFILGLIVNGEKVLEELAATPYWLKRRGYGIVRDVQGRIKVAVR